MIHDKLKKIIFNKLYKDLSHVEIIPFKDSIWFIDRKERHWYFEYEKPDTLWWRWGYFNDFFTLFSMEPEEFQWVLSEWVEEVLNCKVNTPRKELFILNSLVEEVLNCKVNTPKDLNLHYPWAVEEVLNCKVNTPIVRNVLQHAWLEEVLNCKVNTPCPSHGWYQTRVEEVLNCKVNIPATNGDALLHMVEVEEVLNCKVNTTLISCSEMTLMVEGALNHKVNKSGAVGYPGQGVLEEVLDCEITKPGMRKNVMGYCLDNVLNKNK